MNHVVENSIEKSWDLWRDCLIGDDQNSIIQQIYLINWDYAIFLIINESRKIKSEKNPDNPPINAPINRFINKAFFISQSAAIRRMVDESKDGLTGKKGVYSLIALIKNIKNKGLELTREKYLELRKMPYDYSDILEKRRIFFTEQSIKGRGAFFVPRELDCESIENAHKEFDRLSKKSDKERKPDDVICDEIFDLFLKKLEKCKSIKKYVDKYIAHSATPESRKYENADQLKITLKQILEAQQIIYMVAEWLAGFLFAEGHIPLILENPNHFDYLDVPLIANNDELERIKKTFNEFRKKTEEWAAKVQTVILPD